MVKLLSCPRGHFWEAGDADNTDFPQALCPVCGASVDDLPLLDLVTTDAPPPLPTPVPPPLLPEDRPLRDPAGRPVVAGFEVQADVGRSPTGVLVYKARQLLLNRVVLLKVVVAKDDVGQVAWGALRGEATALGRISHPNIVQIHEAGERDRQLFYNAVECVDGPTLAQHLAGKPLPLVQAARLVETLARAVHAAHEEGLAHRSLRPACVYLQPWHGQLAARGTPNGDKKDAKKTKAGPVDPPYLVVGSLVCVPKIADFGLARRPTEGDANDVELQDGLPSYLSPEQAWGRAREIGPASDVYALGAVLYELIAGQPPFRGRTPGETVTYITSREVVRPPRLKPTAELWAVCRKSMHRFPKNRYKSALELADDLRAFAESRPVKARQAGALERLGLWMYRRPLAASLVLVCLLALASVPTAYFVGAGEATAYKTRYDAAHNANLNAQNDWSLANNKLKEAEQREKLARYYRQILLADRDVREGRTNRAQEVLNECPADLRNWEWYYLKYQADGNPAYLTLADPVHPPAKPVVGLSYTPDGKRLAAAFCPADDPFGGEVKGEVRVWDTPIGNLVRYLGDFSGPIRQIAFRPDGLRLATAGADGNRTGVVREWDPDQGQILAAKTYPGETVVAAAYTADGKRLAVLTTKSNPHVLQTGDRLDEVALTFYKPPWDFGGARQTLRLAVLNADATKLAAVSLDGNFVQIHDGTRGQQQQPAESNRSAGEILALAYSPETNLLATGGRDWPIQVWNVQTNKLTATLRGHTGNVTGLSFSRDGKRLASASTDGTVRIWDPATGDEVLCLSGFVAGTESPCVQFSPARDDRQLATAYEKEVRLYGQRPRF